MQCDVYKRSMYVLHSLKVEHQSGQQTMEELQRDATAFRRKLQVLVIVQLIFRHHSLVQLMGAVYWACIGGPASQLVLQSLFSTARLYGLQACVYH